MKFIADHPQGVILKILAKAGASKNEILGIYGDDLHEYSLKVSVQAPPEKGKANKALIKFLKKKLSIKGLEIEILRGKTFRQKQFLLRGVSREKLEKKLETLL